MCGNVHSIEHVDVLKMLTLLRSQSAKIFSSVYDDDVPESDLSALLLLEHLDFAGRLEPFGVWALTPKGCRKLKRFIDELERNAQDADIVLGFVKSHRDR